MSRMWELIEIAETRKLTDTEKAELQVLFLRLARQDVRILHAVQSESEANRTWIC